MTNVLLGACSVRVTSIIAEGWLRVCSCPVQKVQNAFSRHKFN
jgi:hypothetical protein